MMTNERAHILLKRLDLLGLYSWFIIPAAFMVGLLPLIGEDVKQIFQFLCQRVS
jgi:hypothetical protein